MDALSNTDDVIDSRQVIERMEEIEGEIETAQESEHDGHLEEIEVLRVELKVLTDLASEAEGYASDWKYGEPLIRDSYFKRYAQELADDIGAVPSGLSWPMTCIDWDQAARELQMDYTSVDFDGVTYWVRAS